MGIHKQVIKMWTRREQTPYSGFRFLGFWGPILIFTTCHNLSLRTTVCARPIQRKGQFVKDLPAVKCKYLILPVKKNVP